MSEFQSRQERLAKFPSHIAVQMDGVEGICLVEPGIVGFKPFPHAGSRDGADAVIVEAFDTRKPTDAERRAALFASMFGWDVPGADPEKWEETTLHGGRR